MTTTISLSSVVMTRVVISTSAYQYEGNRVELSLSMGLKRPICLQPMKEYIDVLNNQM